MSRLTYTDLANLSMNQVFMRSINTSVVALLPVICMLVVGAGILGAVALEQFSIALLVGLTAGAYSSIFVAAPILVFLKEREPRNRAIRQRVESGRVTAPTLAEAELDTDDEVDPRAPVEVDTGSDAPVTVGSSAGSDGVARPSTPVAAAPASAIPPRPRKKGKRR